jgi:competence protein ComEA
MALVAGRLLDRCDGSFEARDPGEAAVIDSTAAASQRSSATVSPAETLAAAVTRFREPPVPGDSLSVRIAINRATAAELQALPRVGPVLAARILEHRERNGPFHSLLDLQRVPGIGPRTAARLAPLVRFD